MIVNCLESLYNLLMYYCNSYSIVVDRIGHYA